MTIVVNIVCNRCGWQEPAERRYMNHWGGTDDEDLCPKCTPCGCSTHRKDQAAGQQQREGAEG